MAATNETEFWVVFLYAWSQSEEIATIAAARAGSSGKHSGEVGNEGKAEVPCPTTEQKATDKAQRREERHPTRWRWWLWGGVGGPK